ncbi:MAG: restriction endonuclease [Patescibacteria group bacterium]|jgi:hypothetical protein
MQYDFQNLSPIEFEHLVQDLLQEEFKISLESFAPGRDQGIDLRYAKAKKKDLIVQCKRYKSATDLMPVLKKELEKVKALKPGRYILATSVSLTLNQKLKIKKLFKPYIRATGDILSKESINNLITKNENVELRHFKLWLSSTNILRKIIHSKVINQGKLELDKIKEEIKFFVDNSSIGDALDILRKTKVIVISGLPGIGKTTLARMLAYHYLARNSYEEFVYISDSISEGYENFQEGKKQVFLFDDFLGRSFLTKDLPTNEDKRIIEFIESIKRAPNKVLIVTTREYILEQAKKKYENLNSVEVGFSKYVLDLAVYTKMIKAKILYNHLFFSTVPQGYILDLLKSKHYLNIINHKNYSPRIIGAVTKPAIWEKIVPDKYSEFFKNSLDHPDSIWEHVFSNQITPLSRLIVLTKFTCGEGSTFLTDLKDATEKLVKECGLNYGAVFNAENFNNSIKELERTFIQISKDDSNQLAVEFQNPSITDYLRDYLKNNESVVSDLIGGALFFDQLSLPYSFESEKKYGGILLRKPLIEKVVERMSKEYQSLVYARLTRVYSIGEESFRWDRTEAGVIQKAQTVIDKIGTSIIGQVRPLLPTLVKDLILKRLTYVERGQVPALVYKLRKFLTTDFHEIMENYLNSIYYFPDVLRFLEFKRVSRKEYRKFLKKNLQKLIEKINFALENEMDFIDNTELPNLINHVQDVQLRLGIDLSAFIERIENEVQLREKKSDPEVKEINFEREEIGSEIDIVKMFDSLVDQNKD